MTVTQLRTATWAFGGALALIYFAGFVPTAYFRFDDFWQLRGSAAQPLDLAHLLSTANEADGRWNPGMRLSLWLLGALVGVQQAWPYYVVLFAAHTTNILLSVAIAGRLGVDATGRWATAFVGVAAVNLTAYSVTSIFLLHGVLSIGFALAAVLAATGYAHDRRPWRLGVIVGATFAGLACKEYAIISPLLAAAALLTIARRKDFRLWAAIVLAYGLAGALFAATQLTLGLPLIPPGGRYTFTSVGNVARTAAWYAANTLVWLLVPAVMAFRAERRAAVRALCVAAAWVVAPLLPVLVLPWLSPGHLYLVTFSVGIAAGLLISRAGDAASALWRLWMACALLVVSTVVTIAVRHEMHRWGPITRQVIADWHAQRAPGDRRVVWFDADNGGSYGGLARLIGPGIRLRDALAVSGAVVDDAAICIDVVVGPPYQPRPGDALFLNEGGRLRRVETPPFPHATCMP